MTVSFHKYTGEFFPGTGKLDDNGYGLGKHFCLNVPLQDGIDDDMYLGIFKSVIEDTVNAFQPTSIVLQCGADSLGCDRLGAFNLSIAAHGECVNFVRKFNVPLLVVGGGGYTIKNVSRCWTYETSVLVGASIPNELPATVYDSFFKDSQFKLHPPLTGKVDNQNSPASLQRITISIRNKLRYLQGAPSVAMQEIPPDIQGFLQDEERTVEEQDEEISTAIAGERRTDRVTTRNDYYEGDKDNDQEDVAMPPIPTAIAIARGRGVPSARRGRGGRPRGRGRGRGQRPSFRDDEDDDDDDDDSVSMRRARKPKSRGRGRAKSVAVEKDKDRDSNPDPDAFMDFELED
jgi:histone deacetylase 3